MKKEYIFIKGAINKVMNEQIYILENVKSFEPKHIFECGQCFRWKKQIDGSYLGILKNSIINVKKEKNKIIFKGISDNNIKDVCIDYFDLKTDYTKIKNKLSKIDKNLYKAIEYGYGIRILKQDIFEMIISYIISANNNIPRIEGIIEKMCEKYGTKIIYNNKCYYLFPTVQQLKNVTIEEYRMLGAGFRDKRLYETVQMIYNKKIDLEKLNLEKTEVIKEKLMKLPGVGPKVADCILLFGFHRFEVFPIDVWIARVINELYIHKEEVKKVNKKEVLKIAKEKFGALAGVAQQYLYYYRREKK